MQALGKNREVPLENLYLRNIFLYTMGSLVCRGNDFALGMGGQSSIRSMPQGGAATAAGRTSYVHPNGAGARSWKSVQYASSAGFVE